MSKAHLIYFDGRGAGETIRLMLTVAGIEYFETDLTSRQQLLDLIEDDKLMFGMGPYLEWDGTELVKPGVILRYIAKKSGMMGTTPDEEAMIDQLFEGTRDFYNKFLYLGFGVTLKELKEEGEGVVMPKYLPIFEKVLSKNPSGYLVGDSFSLADAGLFEVLLAAEEYLKVNSYNGYPNIQNFLSVVNNLPSITKYRKEIRKPQNTSEYVANCCKVLDWDLTPTI